jgi:hypothetical protein
MLQAGQIISYREMCDEERVNLLQKGMNFHLHAEYSVLLMSTRKGAPFADRVEDNGRTVIYEGHDILRKKNGPDPKRVDQPLEFAGGSQTENGKFHTAALRYKTNEIAAELVRVYEKIKVGIWVYNGMFKLTDAWLESVEHRKVLKFKLEFADDISESDISKAGQQRMSELGHTRMIPSAVKQEVWKRDKGRCQHPDCGASDDLHFDHIIPYSKGGTSLEAKNIQLLCARHNLGKRDRIE